MKLIAFTGKMGSGKSTAIAELRKLVNYQTANVKFAQPLYDIQEFIYKRISGVYQRPESFVKDRTLLQWLGTNWGRDTISDSVWVDIWRHQVDLVTTLQTNVEVITCDDLRFNNEALAVKSAGGIVVQITRKDANPDGGFGIKKHASEEGILDSLIDIKLQNDGNMEELSRKLNRILEMTPQRTTTNQE